jgi:SAM-dependent methyltransferase
MEDLPFDNQTFDLIWAEGSIYNIGFEHGFRKWKRFLKPGGFIAVSEISWLSIARPEELTRYWEREYPGINTISGNLKHIENAGYTPLAVFVVNEDCWQEHFYEPISAALDDFRKGRPEDDTMKAFLGMHYLEIEMFSKYKDYFGYAFYIAGNRA